MVDSISFHRVLLADHLSNGLLGQLALDDAYVRVSDPERLTAARRSQLKQEALALLVMFDEVVIAETGGTGYAVPLLEDSGVLLNVAERPLGIERDFAVEGWYGTRNPQVFSEMLRRTQRFRPLVLNYMMRRKLPVVAALAKGIGTTRRSVIAAMLDLALAHYEGREDQVKANLLAMHLPPKMVKDWRRELTVQKPRNGLNGVDVVLFGAGVGASRIEHYESVSEEFSAGVASHEFNGNTAGWDRTIPSSPRSISDGFAMLRVALHDEGAFFPRIASIEHALKLRKDPALTDFRERLRELQMAIADGRAPDALALRREVANASQLLKRVAKVQRVLNWSTYLSVPISVAETVLHGIPVASGGLAGLSVLATYYQTRTSASSKWILFGR